MRLLKKAGQHHLLKQLESLDTVDDVLRHRPELVGVLLETAWQLRKEQEFRELFRSTNDGQLVQERDVPIGPCGRTFDGIVKSHLLGAARLYFDRLQREWTMERARTDKIRWHKAQEIKKKRRSLSGRLLGGLKDLTAEPPTFEPSKYRNQYPGNGLYEILKPYLTEPAQFRLITSYAQLDARQAEALGDLIAHFKSPQDLKMVVDLRGDDISLARRHARTYAEALLGFTYAKPRRQDVAQADDNPGANLAELSTTEQAGFEALLTKHLDCFELLRETGTKAEAVIRRLTPHVRDEIWTIFQNQQTFDNVVNCPPFVLAVIGPSARAIPPQISIILTHVHDRTLVRDILKLGLERFSREEFESYMSDPERRPVWNSLPTKFNNVYKYQADALPSSSMAFNFDNLKVVSVGFFDSLRTGVVDLTEITGEIT